VLLVSNGTLWKEEEQSAVYASGEAVGVGLALGVKIYLTPPCVFH
jgi:hypothetical protein